MPSSIQEILEHWPEIVGKLPAGMRTICLTSADLRENDEGLVIAVPNNFVAERLREKQKLIETQMRDAGFPNIPLTILCDPTVVTKDVFEEKITGAIERPDTPKYFLKLRPEFTFENFVVGKSNEFAYRAALDIAAWNPSTPLILVGGSGSGKTHLMHAVGREASSRRANAIIKLVHAEAFMRHYQRIAFSDNKAELRKFFVTYTTADILLFDDLHLFDTHKWEKSRFQLRLILDALIERKTAAVFTSERSVETFHNVESAFLSRLRSMRAIRIVPADYDMRAEILIRIAKEKDLELSRELSDMVIERIALDLRAIEGAAAKLKDWARLMGRTIDPQAVEELFGKQPINPRVSFGIILDAVAHHYGISTQIILSPNTAYGTAQHIAMVLCSELLGMDTHQLAEVFPRNAAHISSLITKAKQRLARAEFYEEIEEIRMQLFGMPDNS